MEFSIKGLGPPTFPSRETQGGWKYQSTREGLMKNPLLAIESPLQDLNPVMGGWSEGGEWGLAKGYSLDV